MLPSNVMPLRRNLRTELSDSLTPLNQCGPTQPSVAFWLPIEHTAAPCSFRYDQWRLGKHQSTHNVHQLFSQQHVSYYTNEKFLDISRKGKFLIFHLTNNKVLISHLRMEGKYIELLESDTDTKYARVVFHLDNNHKLCYDDSRSFGRMIMSDENHYLEIKDLTKLGPEPFDGPHPDLSRIHHEEGLHLPERSVTFHHGSYRERCSGKGANQPQDSTWPIWPGPPLCMTVIEIPSRTDFRGDFYSL